jgi:hypothetical protein
MCTAAEGCESWNTNARDDHGIHMGDRLSLMTSVWTMTSPYTTETNASVLFPTGPPASVFGRPLQLSTSRYTRPSVSGRFDHPAWIQFVDGPRHSRRSSPSVIHVVSPGRAGSGYGFTMTRLSRSFERMYRTASLAAGVMFTSALTEASAVRTFSSISVTSCAGSRWAAFLARKSAERSVAFTPFATSSSS